MGLFRRNRQEHLAELDAYRTARKRLEEDVVALGEQLETLTGTTQSEPLDTYARLDLEQAVRRFETGRIALAEAGACRRDLERLEAGHEPDHRLVRVGDRYVKWYEAGPAAGLIPEPGRTTGTRHRQPDRRIAEAHITVGNNPATGGRFGGNPGG